MRLTSSLAGRVAVGLVLAAVAAGCGQDQRPESRSPDGGAAHPSSPTSTDSDVAGTPDATAELRAAVEAYSRAYLSGDAETAYRLLSRRCRERLSRAEMSALTSAAQDLYGGADITSYEAKTSGEFARVTYRYEDYPAIDQESEPWVFERGSWRQDDC